MDASGPIKAIPGSATNKSVGSPSLKVKNILLGRKSLKRMRQLLFKQDLVFLITRNAPEITQDLDA